MYLQKKPTSYVIIQTLGSGNYSTVKLAINQKGLWVAIKQYKPYESDVDQMLNQVKILKSLNHPHIVKFIDCKQKATIKHRNGKIQQCWAMIMEHFNGGQLWDLIYYTRGLSETIARTYFLQIIDALNHMHKQGYVHRDIKPTNIMLSDRFMLKIVDFGFSCSKKGYNGTGILNQSTGTPEFQAPQIIKGKYDGTKVDIFATGVTLFLMFAGRYPFDYQPTSKDEFYNLIIHKNYDIYWEFIKPMCKKVQFSNEFKDLLVRMIAYKPQDRITIAEILQHPWVKGDIFSQDEIYQELYALKENSVKRKQKTKLYEGKLQKQHMNQLQDLQIFSIMRGSGNISNQLIGLINEETKNKRQLVKFEERFKHDIVLKSQASLVYSVARLKHLLNDLRIDLNSSSSDPINFAEVTYDNLLQLNSITENDKNKIQATFKYIIETQKRDILKKVQIIINIGKDQQQRIVFRLIKQSGAEYPFRRILDQVKNTFDYANDQI